MCPRPTYLDKNYYYYYIKNTIIILEKSFISKSIWIFKKTLKINLSDYITCVAACVQKKPRQIHRIKKTIWHLFFRSNNNGFFISNKVLIPWEYFAHLYNYNWCCYYCCCCFYETREKPMNVKTLQILSPFSCKKSVF